MGCAASAPASQPGAHVAEVDGKGAGVDVPAAERVQGDPPPADADGKQGMMQPSPGDRDPPRAGLPGSRSKQDIKKLLLHAVLPVGWEARVDPGTEEVYYVNHNEGITQWERPAAEEGEGQAADTMTRWECKIDPESGAAYWEDHVTKTTTWEKPTC